MQQGLCESESQKPPKWMGGKAGEEIHRAIQLCAYTHTCRHAHKLFASPYAVSLLFHTLPLILLYPAVHIISEYTLISKNICFSLYLILSLSLYIFFSGKGGVGLEKE